ncbi:MAG: TVP38/TMEM64 family protein [Bacillus sp. (in: firmicutes)]
MRSMKTTIKQMLLGLLLLVLLFFLGYWLITYTDPDLIPLLTSGNQEAIEDMLRSETGLYAVLLTIVMEFLQTFSIIIPGMPINIAAGIVFGWLEGTLICTVGFVAANVAVFVIAKRVRGLVKKIVPSTNQKNSRWKFISEAKNPVLMITLAFATPGVPNGFIPYVSSTLPVTTKSFAAAVFCGSLPGIIFSNFIGHFLLRRNYLAVGVLAAVWLLLYALALIGMKLLHKTKKVA